TRPAACAAPRAPHRERSWLRRWRSTRRGGIASRPRRVGCIMDTRALGAATVLDSDGTPVRLADQWHDQPAVIVWLRHFGCVFCREQVAEIREHREEIEALGAGIAFVGNGTPRAAAWFQKRFAPDSTVLTDPDLV